MNFCGLLFTDPKDLWIMSGHGSHLSVADEESCTKVKLPLFGTGKEFIGELVSYIIYWS